MDQDKLNIIELHGISIVFSSMSIISSVITKFRIGQESEYSWESFSVQKRRERTESPSTKTSIKVPRSATIAIHNCKWPDKAKPTSMTFTRHGRKMLSRSMQIA